MISAREANDRSKSQKKGRPVAPERAMRVLWVAFVLAIGVALIVAMYALRDLGTGSTGTENRTQLSHSMQSGSAFDK
jgi:hypothetical protein